MASGVKQNNRNAIKDRMKLPRITIKVGVQGTEAERSHGSVTIVDIAAIHEFGLGNVPERSWLRAWFDEHEAEGLEKLRKGFQKVIAGSITVETLGTALGTWAVASIQERISAGISPDLAETTKAGKAALAKGQTSYIPLIDTGLFRSSITFIVEVDGQPITGVTVKP